MQSKILGKVEILLYLRCPKAPFACQNTGFLFRVWKSQNYEAGEDRIPSCNMAVSAAKTSTAPLLLKEGDITEASDAGKKPANLGKANLLFWQRFRRDRESTARKTTIYFVMFTSNDVSPLV